MTNYTKCAPSITPVADGSQRPLWSVMIPTYNCAAYLRQTLQSVLAQDPGPEVMQIEVVDDGSTLDDPEAVVDVVGNDRIKFYKQAINVGAIPTFNTCIQRSVGQFIHILHGDDLVINEFYRRLERPLLDDPTIGAAFCRQTYIDDQNQPILTTRLEQPASGILPNALDILAVSNRIPPPAIVVRRSVYEKLGGYDTRLFHSADWEMWVRIAAAYPIWYEVEPLALYRVHPGSDTSKLFRTGANMQNRREAIKIFRAYLPPSRANNLTRRALGYSAMYGLRMAFQLISNPHISRIQFREALVCAWQMLQR